ncbi:MAG: hypothetical protein M0C28_14275 [Candidatus Moduliflexus flocculans]|nr:hypothetical protein [Candidatus Moduliflexus flocculans]
MAAALMAVDLDDKLAEGCCTQAHLSRPRNPNKTAGRPSRSRPLKTVGLAGLSPARGGTRRVPLAPHVT